MKCEELIFLGAGAGWAVCCQRAEEFVHFRYRPMEPRCPKHLAEHRKRTSEPSSKETP